MLTPVVRARRDGIHLVVDNRTDREQELDYDVDGGDGGGGGEAVRRGRSTVVVAFAARRISVSCGTALLDRHVTIRVHGRQRSPDTQCPHGSATIFVHVVPRGRETPVATARRYLRATRSLRRGDVVERAVSQPDFPIVRVVRGRRVVAALGFEPDPATGRIELTSVEACR